MTQTAPTLPQFSVVANGEPSDGAIAALARLLIAHAERELAAESGQRDQDQQYGGTQE